MNEQTIPEPLSEAELLERLAGLAEEVGGMGLQALQDASYLLLEVASGGELTQGCLIPLQQWLNLAADYQQSGASAVATLLGFLRRPEWNLPLSEAEFAMLESMLRQEAPNPAPLANTAKAQLEALAEQASQQGLQALQDINLLLLESLNESPDSAHLLGLLESWPLLVDGYFHQGPSAVPALIAYLNLPEWNLPLAEEELEMLESMLIDEAQALPKGGAADFEVENPANSDLADMLQALAEQAGQEGLQGLQDASYLLLEAWAEGAASQQIRALISTWPQLVIAYRSNPASAVPQMLALLQEETLALPLNAEEFELIATLLQEEAGLSREAETPSWNLEIDPPDSETRQRAIERQPRKSRELLELLLMQTDMIDAQLPETPQQATHLVEDDWQNIQEQVERFANAAQTVGFVGLSQLSSHIEANIGHFAQAEGSWHPDHIALLKSWLSRTRWYLLDYTDHQVIHELLANAVRTDWPSALPVEVGAAILASLRGLDNQNLNQGEASRAQTASAEDVSLTLPQDVNQELLEILLQELPLQARQLSESVQKLQKGGSLEDVNLAQRIAHTLKGSANTVGIKGVAVLTHHLEDILLACAKEQQTPGPQLANTLMDAADCLEAMGDALLGQGDAPVDALATLQKVMDWANRIDGEGLVVTELAQSGSDEEATPVQAEQATAQADSEAAAQASTLRIPVDWVDNLFRQSGENIILNGQATERLRRVKQYLQAMQTQFELLRQLGAELDTLIDLRDLSGRGLSKSSSDFDSLEMDQYNELHTAGRRMVEAAVDAREFSLDADKELAVLEAVLDDQQALVIDSQTTLMQTKLSPIHSITPRLQRSLRQTCRLTGKQAELRLTGAHLLIDGDTLNALLDPFMHLLRNAVDHGIEPEEERQLLGKPSVGTIHFEFEVTGNDILIRCRDDGRGLDLGAIRAAAERRGLIKAGESIPTDELERLILKPNFSSRTESTQTSGRGVGMDVVYAQILALGGELELESQAGKGLTVRLQVPLPLSRSHALLVHVGEHRVIVSHKGINQIFYSGAGEWLEVEGESRLELDGKIYPTVRLNHLLELPGNPQADKPHGAILLVHTEHHSTALLLDAIVDSRDVVIKPLGPYVAKLPGIIGATILGDGSVTPVIDIPELLRAPARAANREALPFQPNYEAELPQVLVVDDSITNRRVLEYLLQDAGFKVRTAHDGLDAVEHFNQRKPDIILTDLEMPRMNGIELAAHIRTRPGGKSIPIIMITSRTTQRHRQLADDAGVNAYFTKPVREDELLDQIHSLINEVPSPAPKAVAVS